AGKDTEKVDNRLAIPLFHRHAHGSAHWGFDGQRPPTAHENGACMSAARFHAELKTPDISHRPGAVYVHLALYAERPCQLVRLIQSYVQIRGSQPGLDRQRLVRACPNDSNIPREVASRDHLLLPFRAKYQTRPT